MGSRLALIAACLAALAAGASAHAAADPPAAADGRRRRGRAREGGPLGADAKMSLASLAGFDTIRITSIWSPGRPEVGGDRAGGLQTAADAARLNGIRLIVSVYPYGRRPRRRYATARAQFAVLRGVDPAARAVRPLRDRRQRAEPEPLLDAAVHARRGSTRPPSSYLGLLAQTYDAIKAAAPGGRVIGGSLAPRGGDNPALARPTHSPTQLHPRPGHRLPAQRPDAAGDGLVLVPPVPRARRASRPPSRTRGRRRSRSPTTASCVRLLGRAFDGTAPARLDAADHLRRVRRADERSPTTSGALREPGLPSARATRSTRRRRPATTAQALQLAACQTERRRAPLLPRHRRGRARPLAVRRLLRGRHAEVESPGRAARPPGGARRNARQAA